MLVLPLLLLSVLHVCLCADVSVRGLRPQPVAKYVDRLARTLDNYLRHGPERQAEKFPTVNKIFENPEALTSGDSLENFFRLIAIGNPVWIQKFIDFSEGSQSLHKIRLFTSHPFGPNYMNREALFISYNTHFFGFNMNYNGLEALYEDTVWASWLYKTIRGLDCTDELKTVKFIAGKIEGDILATVLINGVLHVWRRGPASVLVVGSRRGEPATVQLPVDINNGQIYDEPCNDFSYCQIKVHPNDIIFHASTEALKELNFILLVALCRQYSGNPPELSKGIYDFFCQKQRGIGCKLEVTYVSEQPFKCLSTPQNLGK